MTAAPVTAKPMAGALGGADFATGHKIRALRAVDLGLPTAAALNALRSRRDDQHRNGQPLEIGFARNVGSSRIDLTGL
ncbi:MAG: serine protease, partial [Lysobacter sp.]|nr:serine protease [Lysobacter sp.]